MSSIKMIRGKEVSDNCILAIKAICDTYDNLLDNEDIIAILGAVLAHYLDQATTKNKTEKIKEAKELYSIMLELFEKQYC